VLSIVSPYRFLQIGALLAETEAFYQFLVAADILPVQINKQTSSLSDKLEQAALGVEIVFVSRHMACKLLYSFRQHGYLDFG
jgi:hypothetical protein